MAQRAVKSKERSQSQETEEKELLGAKSREVRQPVVEAVVASSSSAAVVRTNLIQFFYSLNRILANQ